MPQMRYLDIDFLWANIKSNGLSEKWVTALLLILSAAIGIHSKWMGVFQKLWSESSWWPCLPYTFSCAECIARNFPFFHQGDPNRCWGCSISFCRLIRFKLMSIVAAQPILRAHPHESVLTLDDGGDRILWQSIFSGQVIKKRGDRLGHTFQHHQERNNHCQPMLHTTTIRGTQFTNC